MAEAFSVVPDVRPVDLPPTQDIPDVPAWHGFEHKLWALGEQVRQFINKKPSLLNDRDLYSQLFRIVKNRAAKRGRQSWILLFAYKPCEPWALELASLLPDPDIDGHIISALYKMKAFGFSARVQPFLDSGTTWNRKVAIRYIAFDQRAEQGVGGQPLIFPSSTPAPLSNGSGATT
jgi:hypothetical protein